MRVDKSGQRFGRVVAIAPVGKNRHGQTIWQVKCDCGRTVNVTATSLSPNGKGRSCGCWERKQHGMTKTPEYAAWLNMINRCTRPTCNSYHNYGGRGISVCSEWMQSFDAFFKHAGPRPSSLHSIDRINNDGNYEPGNVRWITWREQMSNMRKSIHITWQGETHTVSEWSRRTGLDHKVISARFRKHLPLDLVFRPTTKQPNADDFRDAPMALAGATPAHSD